MEELAAVACNVRSGIAKHLVAEGFSLSVSLTYRRFLESSILNDTSQPLGVGFPLLMGHILLLIGWSWTGGFVVGSLSRKTLWVSAALCASHCLFCLSRFRVESLSRFCLLLFLLPAIWGVCQGLRVARIKLRSAVVLAVTVTY